MSLAIKNSGAGFCLIYQCIKLDGAFLKRISGIFFQTHEWISLELISSYSAMWFKDILERSAVVPPSLNLTFFKWQKVTEKKTFSPPPLHQRVSDSLARWSVCFCSDLVTGSDSNISLHGIQQSVSGNNFSHTAWLIAISKYVHLFQNTKVSPFKLIFLLPITKQKIEISGRQASWGVILIQEIQPLEHHLLPWKSMAPCCHGDQYVLSFDEHWSS